MKCDAPLKGFLGFWSLLVGGDIFHRWVTSWRSGVKNIYDFVQLICQAKVRVTASSRSPNLIIFNISTFLSMSVLFSEGTFDVRVRNTWNGEEFRHLLTSDSKNMCMHTTNWSQNMYAKLCMHVFGTVQSPPTFTTRVGGMEPGIHLEIGMGDGKE